MSGTGAIEHGEGQFNNLDSKLPQETSGREFSGLKRAIIRALKSPLPGYISRPALIVLTALGVGTAMDIGTKNQAVADAFHSSLDNASKWAALGSVASRKPYGQQIKDIEDARKVREYLKSLEAEQTTSFTVKDIRVVNGSHTVAALVLPDGTRVFAEGDVDPIKRTLALKQKATLNFNAYGVFVSSTNTNIAGVFGNAGPGQDIGEMVLTKDGWVNSEVINNGGGGSVIDADLTEDNKYLVARQSAGAILENDYVYKAYNLNTGSSTTLTNCAGCVEGGIQAPITRSPTNPNIYVTGDNSAFPNAGYTHTEINIQTSQTLTTTRLHPEQGYPFGRRLPQFTNKKGEHEVWLINNDIIDQTGTRRIGKIFRNFNDIHNRSMDISPTLSLYPEADSGGVLYDVLITAAAASPSLDQTIIATEVNINNVLYAHLEVSSLSNPGDLTQRMLVPEDGDWSKDGMHGDSIYSVNYLYQGAEIYLLVDRRTDAGNCLLIRRITNGFNSADQWKKVVFETGAYKAHLPIALKNH